MRDKKYIDEERETRMHYFEGSFEKEQFKRGIELFDTYTNNGKKVITNRDINALRIEDLECLMHYCAVMSDLEGRVGEETSSKCVSLLADKQGDLLLKTTDWIIELANEDVFRK